MGLSERRLKLVKTCIFLAVDLANTGELWPVVSKESAASNKSDLGVKFSFYLKF
jgi:hypothetical protein